MHGTRSSSASRADHHAVVADRRADHCGHAAGDEVAEGGRDLLLAPVRKAAGFARDELDLGRVAESQSHAVGEVCAAVGLRVVVEEPDRHAHAGRNLGSARSGPMSSQTISTSMPTCDRRGIDVHDVAHHASTLDVHRGDDVRHRRRRHERLVHDREGVHGAPPRTSRASRLGRSAGGHSGPGGWRVVPHAAHSCTTRRCSRRRLPPRQRSRPRRRRRHLVGEPALAQCAPQQQRARRYAGRAR